MVKSAKKMTKPTKTAENDAKIATNNLKNYKIITNLPTDISKLLKPISTQTKTMSQLPKIMSKYPKTIAKPLKHPKNGCTN